MPIKDVSVEFWARTPAYNKTSASADKKFEELLNYATYLPDAEGRFSALPFVAAVESFFKGHVQEEC